MVVMCSSNGRRPRPRSPEGVCTMLRQTMIVLATATALTAGLTVHAFARGGGGHGGGFGGGAHIGGGFGGARMGGVGVGPRVGGGFGRSHFSAAPARLSLAALWGSTLPK